MTTKYDGAGDVGAPGGAEAPRRFTATLSHEDRGVMTFAVVAGSEHAAMAEAARFAGRFGGGWRLELREGGRVVARREPGAAG